MSRIYKIRILSCFGFMCVILSITLTILIEKQSKIIENDKFLIKPKGVIISDDFFGDMKIDINISATNLINFIVIPVDQIIRYYNNEPFYYYNKYSYINVYDIKDTYILYSDNKTSIVVENVNDEIIYISGKLKLTYLKYIKLFTTFNICSIICSVIIFIIVFTYIINPKL